MRLSEDRTDRDQLTDRVGCPELGDDMAGGRGVDHDEVPAGAALDRLAHLPADLADGEDLLHPRRGGGDEIEHPGERPEPADDRHLEVEPQVLLQARLGVHRHQRHPGHHLAGRERDGAAFEALRDGALRVDVDDEDPPAPLRRDERERRRDGALADAALSRDDEQAPPEEVGLGHARSGLAAEAHLAARIVDDDLHVADLVGRDPHLAPLGVLEPHERLPALDRLVDLRLERRRVGVGLERDLLGRVDHSDVDFHA